MSEPDKIDEWMGTADLLTCGEVTYPRLSVEEALAMHQREARRREVAEAEAQAARAVFEEKEAAVAKARAREHYTAGLLVLASSFAGGVAEPREVDISEVKWKYVGRTEIRGSGGGTVIGYTQGRRVRDRGDAS